jgi:hypothetical protein
MIAIGVQDEHEEQRWRAAFLAKATVSETDSPNLGELGGCVVRVVIHKKPPSRGPELIGDHSSIDSQGGTDDVGSLVRPNEQDGICNFFWSADAFVRNL